MPDSHHAELVSQAIEAGSASALAASWRRSMLTHALDPAARRRREMLAAPELSARRAASARMRRAADPLLDHLFSLVCASGCGVFLSDRDGVVLDRRCRAADDPAFTDWNLREGACWSEEAEGTNGIGTCLAEGRRVVIHRGEHFAARNTGMSCIDAPIFGPEGAIAGALDVSSARADQSGGMNRLMAEAVNRAARQIEAELFRAAFPHARVAILDAEAAALVAIDGDDVVIGASRTARRRFGLEAEGTLTPRPAGDVLGEAPDRRGFDRGEYAAIKRALLRHDGNASAAARDLGIGRATLYRRAKRLGLDALPS